MKRAGRTITYEILITEEDYKSEQAREFVAFWNNGSLKLIIPGLSEPPVRTLGATFPEIESHVYR